jgi:hypothetical protein
MRAVVGSGTDEIEVVRCISGVRGAGRRRGDCLGGLLVFACLVKVSFDHGNGAWRILAKEHRS